MMTAMFRTRIRTMSLLVAGVLAAGLVTTACGDAAAGPVNTAAAVSDAQTHGPVGAVVTLDYQSYEPGVVTVQVGQSVEWKWADFLPENVEFADGTTSPVQSTGTWYRTFTTPGTYTYQCSFHVRMVGTVIVESAHPS